MFSRLIILYISYKNRFFSIPNIALAAYFMTFLMLLKIRSIKLSKKWVVPLFAMYVGMCFGTLLVIFFNGEDSSLYEQDHFFNVILDILNPLNRRGKVMYGGYLGSIFGIWLANFIFKQKSLPEFLDITAISSSLFFAIWRIGCFLGGCCYGRPSETFGISFPERTDAFSKLKETPLVIGNATVPLLPTQLISSAYGFAIFLFLLVLFCKNKTRYPYFYFFAQMFLYGIGRFTVEFCRIDPREFWGPLSMSQWISLGLVAVSLVFFIKNRNEIVQSFRRDVS